MVILTPGFAADEQDTTAIPALQLYTRFLQTHNNDLNIRIVAFQYPFKSGSYTWNGLPVYSAGGRNRKLTRIFTWIKVLAHLRRLHKKEGFGLHSYYERAVR